MANRTRPNQILFFVSDDEKRIIKAKMAQLGTRNMGAYLRKMAIDGYIIKVDYTPPQSAVLPQTSIRFAAASTPPDTSMRTILQN